MVDGPTPREAYEMVSAEMYVPGEDNYIAPDEVLETLEPDIVAAAKSHAEKNGLSWPPVASGWVMVIGVALGDDPIWKEITR